MSDRSPKDTRSVDDIADLRIRLEEAEDTLAAIRSGSVDALAVQTDEGHRIFVLETADYAYRVVLSNMHEGVVTVSDDGTIVYCNPFFSRLARMRAEEILGRSFTDFVQGEDAAAVQLLGNAHACPQVTETYLLAGDGLLVPVRLSVTRCDVDQPTFCILVSDLTEQKAAEKLLLERQQKLRRLVSELTLTEERERYALATALHDSLGQTLAFMRMKLGAAREHASGEKIEAQLRELDGFLVKAIAETRSLTTEISPPMLFQLGLEAAVKWLAEDIKQQHGFSIRFQGTEQLHSLTEDLLTILYRAVRELLINAVKHAGASEAVVSVTRKSNSLVIEVADDGQGFDPAAAYRAGGASFGLFSIRERLEDVAGALRIESSPGVGSRCILTVPLGPPEE